MASISANTFRVFAQKGAKYILVYYPGQVLVPEAGRSFEVSVLHYKDNGAIRLLAYETVEAGRPNSIKMKSIHTKLKLALYHAIQRWEAENSIDQC